MRVLFDTNVLLEVFHARRPHFMHSAQLLSRVEDGKLDGSLCATTLTTLYYLTEKWADRTVALKHVRNVLSIFDVAPVSKKVLTTAVDLGFRDYEDGVLYEAARAHGVDGVVTRDPNDFLKSRLPIYSPEELLSVIARSEE